MIKSNQVESAPEWQEVGAMSAPQVCQPPAMPPSSHLLQFMLEQRPVSHAVPGGRDAVEYLSVCSHHKRLLDSSLT